jgi:hypothetical protein
MGAMAIASCLMLGPQVSPENLEEAHRRMLARADLQFTLGEPPAEPPPPTSSWLSQLLDGLGPIFNIVFWGALAAVIAGILYFIGREVLQSRYGGDRRVKSVEPVQQTAYRPEPERARALIADADSLAAQGRFEEAVRILLHRSIDDIEQRAPRSIKRAQTSREISRLSILSGAAAEAFAPLVRAVEQAWFGGAELKADDYQRCRDSYVHFALPEAWR